MGAGQARLQDPPHPPYTCPSLEPPPARSPLMAMVTAGPGRISSIFTNHSEAWGGGGGGGRWAPPGPNPLCYTDSTLPTMEATVFPALPP